MAAREIDPATRRRRTITLWVVAVIFAAFLAVAVEAAVCFNQAVAISNHETAAYESLTTVRSDIQSAVERADIDNLVDAFDSQDLKKARQETAAADAIAHNGNWTFLSHVPLTRNDVAALQALTGAANSLTHQVLDDYHQAVTPFDDLVTQLTPITSGTADAATQQKVREQVASAEATSQKSLDAASAGLKAAAKRLHSAPTAKIGVINMAVSQMRDLLDSTASKTSSLSAKSLVNSVLSSEVSKGRLTQEQAQSLGM